METQSNVIREVLLSQEFEDYFERLDSRTQEKYAYIISIIETQYVVNEKFVKKLTGSDFYELRVPIGTNEYRTILIAMDHDNFMQAKRVILLNSFLKKDTKQYKREITKAEKLLQALE